MKKEIQRHSVGSNVVYAFKRLWLAKKSAVACCGAAVVVRVAVPFTGILLPKLVIDELTAQVTPMRFLTVVGGITALLVLLHFIQSYTDAIVDSAIGTINAFISISAKLDKQMDMDYELMESPETKKRGDQAQKASESNHTPAHNIAGNTVRLLVKVVGLLLNGGVIMTVHPVIAVLLVFSAGVNWLMLAWARKYEKNTREARSKIIGKLHHLSTAMRNKSGAKDIRLYHMTDWLKSLAAQLLTQAEGAEGKVATRDMLAQLTDALLILVRDGAAYAFLIYLLLDQRITLGDFVFIFAAIGAFAGWVSGLIVESSDLTRAASELDDLRIYLEYPDHFNRGVGAALPDKQTAPAIVLEDVSYTYPEAQTPALSHINLHIKPGERIAVVGANGAGKTTLVKLICGLYRPQTGRITLAGTDIAAFNRDEYYTLFSAVFQDIHLMAEDILQNVSQTIPPHTDAEQVTRSLRLAGLYDKVQKLPQKEHTPLVREVNEDAVEFSGGEKQKLALARALYKDAPVIVLDEPTAALDPIAENEVYRQYAELTKNKTSIYISHRLASTRFCDRIIFIDDHRIAESGTHEELMKQGGQYARMFEIQAHYYNNDETDMNTMNTNKANNNKTGDKTSHETERTV